MDLDCQKLNKDYTSLLAHKRQFDAAIEAKDLPQARELNSWLEEKFEFFSEEVFISLDIAFREDLAQKMGFTFVGDFKDGWAITRLDDYLINQKGEKFSVPPLSDEEIKSVGAFSEGYAWVLTVYDDLYLVDKKGQIKFHRENSATAYNDVKEGMAKFSYFNEDKNDTVWTYVNAETGEEIGKFKQALDFSCGLASVGVSKNKVVFINKKGEIVTDKNFPEGFFWAGSFYDGIALVTLNSPPDERAYINLQGEVVARGFDVGHNFNEGFTFVGDKMGRNWRVMDSNGNYLPVGPFTTTDSGFSEGKTWVAIEDPLTGKSLSFFIDKQGNKLFGKEFFQCRRFSEGLAAVQNEKGYWTFINSKGEYITEDRFDEAYVFRNGAAKVIKNNREYLLNKSGEIVTPEGAYGIKGDGKGVWYVQPEPKNDPETGYYINSKGQRVFEKKDKK